MSTIGERIKEARISKNLKQDELAIMIGEKPKGVLSNWENDKNKPNADQIIKLCNALDISPSYLLDFNPQKKMSLNPEEINIINDFRTLDKDGQDLVKYVIEHETKRTEQINKISSYYEYDVVAAHSGDAFMERINHNKDLMEQEINKRK